MGASSSSAAVSGVSSGLDSAGAGAAQQAVGLGDTILLRFQLLLALDAARRRVAGRPGETRPFFIVYLCPQFQIDHKGEKCTLEDVPAKVNLRCRFCLHLAQCIVEVNLNSKKECPHLIFLFVDSRFYIQHSYLHQYGLNLSSCTKIARCLRFANNLSVS